MATTVAGNYITGVIGLTCWAEALIEEGLLVEVVGDYKVALPSGVDGAAALGHVVKGNTDVGAIHGNLTVEAYGTGVFVGTSGGAITAGDSVTGDAAGKVVTTANVATRIGIALTTTVGADESVDVLFGR